ncbi:MAG: hypothetical protein Q7J25_13370 [Vicinamibacterales bacterium]|nr:hypothetical protein [Vicinamibacterales bacterium]
MKTRSKGSSAPAAFGVSKGTIRFQPGKPLPVALLKRLITSRVAVTLGR